MSALACFVLSHLILIKGRSVPDILDLIRSTSSWVILLKSSSSLKAYIFTLLDTLVKTKIFLFVASAV